MENSRFAFFCPSTWVFIVSANIPRAKETEHPAIFWNKYMYCWCLQDSLFQKLLNCCITTFYKPTSSGPPPISLQVCSAGFTLAQ